MNTTSKYIYLNMHHCLVFVLYVFFVNNMLLSKEGIKKDAKDKLFEELFTWVVCLYEKTIISRTGGQTMV